MVRFLLFLAHMFTANRAGRQDAAWCQAGVPYGRGGAGTAPPQAPAATGPAAMGAVPPAGPGEGGSWPGQAGPGSQLPPGSWPPWHYPAGGPGAPGMIPGGQGPPRPGFRPRRRILRRFVWGAAVAAVCLIFRRAIAAIVLSALSAVLHFAGVSAHLPHIRFAWPWQSISAGTTTNTGLGPWVLQRIEGVSKPALGTANFSFLFTHKVSKNIGPWPCWYASTFYAVGHASATVNLNPGTAWWTPGTGHFRLQALSRPSGGKPGRVTVTMVLPQPQLPQSAHDVTIDNIPSRPVDTQHSWTYPGLGCGVLLRPQFPESVLYAQAQQIAFYRATHVPQITGPLISSAKTEATQIVRDNFIQPAVNAFGYTLDQFTIRWAAAR